LDLATVYVNGGKNISNGLKIDRVKLSIKMYSA
jgi:hypothetical protein